MLVACRLAGLSRTMPSAALARNWRAAASEMTRDRCGRETGPGLWYVARAVFARASFGLARGGLPGRGRWDEPGRGRRRLRTSAQVSNGPLRSSSACAMINRQVSWLKAR
jgi:hypothetical protein